MAAEIWTTKRTWIVFGKCLLIAIGIAAVQVLIQWMRGRL